MVQLKVQDTFLDLYQEEPLKLNFSIEDITDAQARSIFSRSFRVPATKVNYEFFKTAFMVNGIDFDVTQRYDATILVDGNEFRRGQLRLEKIFNDGAGNNIDYQCLFLGETTDFGSSVGDKTLCQLNLGLTHDFSLDNIEASWQAYPEGGVNDGLLNGDVLYPLIDFGNTYDEDGNPEQSKIAYQDSSGHHTVFTSEPINYTRFKPMIRVKKVMEQIFEEAGYTFTSDFMDSEDFLPIYTSAWGNETNINSPLGTANAARIQMYIEKYLTPSDPGTIPYDRIVQDPGNNFNEATFSYVCPVDSTVADPYQLYHYTTMKYAAHPSGTLIAAIGVQVKHVEALTGVETIIKSGSDTSDSGYIDYFTLENLSFNANTALLAAGHPTGDINAGDSFKVTYTPLNCFFLSVLASWLWVEETPGQMEPSTMFDCDYKQIDFVKDVLTKFRLVMAPDRNIPNNFIIEPWSNYIATGGYYDWTDKIALNKDMIIEPTFYSQSSRIVFEDKRDGDWLNTLNFEQFDETFGTLIFESGNDLLKDTRNIKTNFAASPLTIMEGTLYSDNTPLLQPHTHTAEDTYIAHNPIKPITRILYYNGLRTFTGNGSTHNYYVCPSPYDADFDPNCGGNNDGRAYTQYSLVTSHQDWPTIGNSIDLHWQVEQGYTRQPTTGRSCYDQFWLQYINNLYDPQARTVTYYIELNSVDLQDFTFDDIIFIKDTYYYVQKITDALVGERSLVKVELVKLLDVILIQNAPPVDPSQPTWNLINQEFGQIDTEWDEL